MRPRKKDRHLPQCMQHRHGAYFFVKRGKWERLSADYAEALQEYALRVATGDGGMAELIDRVYNHIKPGLAKSTQDQYDVARRKLKPILQEFSPEQVRPKHVAAIKVHFADTPNMANRMLSFLRVVFAHAVEWQVVESNPCIGIKRHKEARRRRLITDDEFATIRAASPHKALPIIMDLCFLTGQRIGDVLAIRNTDITPAGIAFEQQKTDARLLVRMTPEIDAVIAAARASHPKTGDWLLYTRNGTPYSYGTIKDAFDRAKEAAQINDVTLHDIRAMSLTRINKEGGNAQALGGHTDPRMTQRYIRDKETPEVSGPAIRPKASRH